MKFLRYLLRKSNWVCHIPCKSQFRGKCYKKPPVDIVPLEISGMFYVACKNIS